MKDKDILRSQIVGGHKKPEFYEQLSRTMGFLDVKELTKLAMEKDNVNAVMALAKTNVYAATSAMSTQEGDEFLQRQANNTQGFSLVQLFFMIRTVAPPKTRKLMKNLAKKVILKTSLKMAGRGLKKGLKRERVPYHPGMSEFDELMTLMNSIERGTKPPIVSYRDIVGIERKQIKKNVVLILDTSGSMYGKALLNAALTTSVLSYVMYKNKYSVLLFNERALFLKHLNEKVPVESIIDNILDAEATGFTNIEIALERGLEELNKVKTSQRDKFAVLVTDGNYLRGDHPKKIAVRYPKLYVVGIPQEKNQMDGLKICRETAEAGNGTFYPVSNYNEIPRMLLKILQKV